MTTLQWILADHVVALLSVAAWFATGVAAALQRARLAFWLLTGAVLAVLTRLGTVAFLAGHGWWFVQEKVLLALPLVGLTTVLAVVVAVPPLLRPRRTTDVPARCAVASFAAGFAALAGLAATLVVGYPLAWSTVLIVLAGVGAATLLTARLLTVEAGSGGRVGAADIDSQPGLSRRRLLTTAGGVAIATAGGAGAGLALLPAAGVTVGGGPGPTSQTSASVADLRGAARPAAGGTRRTYALTARKATTRLASGKQLDAWTYNGRTPGPPIVVTEGDLIEVTLRNADIDDGVTLHWHGYDVPCGEDGAPGATQAAVVPGAEFVYRFRADQVGTYWYHTHKVSHVGVRKGMYGTLVVHPREGRSLQRPDERLDLTLPVHTFENTVAIGRHDGRLGRAVRAGTPVRLRIINTDSEPHQLALAGTAFRLAAVDGRDLHRPGDIEDVGLRLPAGGRYDLVFGMPPGPVALVLDNDQHGGLLLRPADSLTENEPGLPDTMSWPELDLLRYGQPADVPFDPAEADRHFTLVLDRGVAMVDGRPTYAHTVNGRGHPSIPDVLVAEGDVVRFTVVNRSLETHPWHLHGHPVLILSRNGRRSSGSPVWVDTFDVRPGEVWEVAFEATNPGVWMNHCHNLPHAHQGMMLRLAYDGITSVDGRSGPRAH